MFENLTDDTLLANFRKLVATERRTEREIIEHIAEIMRRRAFLGLGYSDLFSWLTKDLGYSEPAANLRIAAAKLWKIVPAISQKLDTGELNLSTLARASIAIRAKEKRMGAELPAAQRLEAVKAIESCSVRVAERKLAALFPEPAPAQDILRVMNENEIRAHVTLTPVQLEKLRRASELLSHKLINANLAQIIEAAVDELLERRDPLLKKTKAAVVRRTSAPKKIPKAQKVRKAVNVEAPSEAAREVKKKKRNDLTHRLAGRITASVRRAVYQRDKGRCQFRSQPGSPICGSRIRTEVEHVLPKAQGGTNEPSNLCILCRPHNILMAERAFGKTHMEKFRRK